MKKNKKFVTMAFAVLLSANVFLVDGCGKKESEVMQEDYEDYADIGYIEDSDDSDIGSESVIKINFEGEEGAELNGKIESITPSGTGLLIANTTEGNLFLLDPDIDFYFEDSKIKSYKMTDHSNISDLTYANQHVVYGENGFVYYDTIGEYVESYEADSYALPEYVYTFGNIQKIDIADARDLILMTDEARYYVFVDKEGRVCVDYRNSSDEEYTRFSDVPFAEGESEGKQVVVNKSAYQFILTEDQELFYIKNVDFGGNVESVSIDYIDLTDKIGGKVTDIYNLENNTECCYAVDEDHNIYYVSVDFGDDITVNEIAKVNDITVTDIQGFSGQNENMLIRADDGSYYYNDGVSGDIKKIEKLDQTYKKAVLLMDEDIIALGNDGYFYIIGD